MKNVKSTKSGFDFESHIETQLFSINRFSDDVLNQGFCNVHNYCDLQNTVPNGDINKFLLSQGNNIYLLKNHPLYNYLQESIEYCIKIVRFGVVYDCYIECKFADVNGTTYQKMGHYITEHQITHHKNPNSYLVLVYDGQQFQGNTKSVLQVENIKENYIKYNFKQLILDVSEFENVFLEKLRVYNGDFSKIFVEMKKEGY